MRLFNRTSAGELDLSPGDSVDISGILPAKGYDVWCFIIIANGWRTGAMVSAGVTAYVSYDIDTASKERVLLEAYKTLSSPSANTKSIQISKIYGIRV